MNQKQAAICAIHAMKNGRYKRYADTGDLVADQKLLERRFYCIQASEQEVAELVYCNDPDRLLAVLEDNEHRYEEFLKRLVPVEKRMETEDKILFACFAVLAVLVGLAYILKDYL